MIQSITRGATRAVGAVVTGVFAVLTALGMEVGDHEAIIESINSGITALGMFIGVVIAAYGQFVKKDNKDDNNDTTDL